MHSEIVLPGGQMKGQPQTVQISCNICAFIKHMHYQQCLFRYLYVFILYVFMLSLSYRIQIPGKCRLRNFYLLMLLKISTLIKLLL